MPTWAIVITAALGGGVVCLLLLYGGVRRFLGNLVKGLTEGSVPVRIQAVPKPDDKPWYNPDYVSQARKFFEKQGFEWIRDVAFVPMEGVFASLLVDRDGFGVVIYDHTTVGAWVDVVVIYQGRGGLTVSSVAQGGKLEPPPFSHKFYMPKATPEQVWALFQDKVRAIPLEGRLALTPENFVAQFEQAYADEIDWRNAQGGPSEGEIRELADGMPNVSGEEQIQGAVGIQRAMANAGLLEGLQQRFRDVMTPEQNLRFRLADLHFVHARLTHEDLLGYVSNYIQDEEYEVMALPDACRGLGPLEAFEKLQGLLPTVVQFEKVGSLDFPLATDVYRPPNGQIPIDIFPHRRRVEHDEDK